MQMQSIRGEKESVSLQRCACGIIRLGRIVVVKLAANQANCLQPAIGYPAKTEEFITGIIDPEELFISICCYLIIFRLGSVSEPECRVVINGYRP